jgi:NAD(P)-dependent dehydrogenase (short-subunit alcohol dehydrogenase family)
VAVVTGVALGIGRGIAATRTEEGFQVAIDAINLPNAGEP